MDPPTTIVEKTKSSLRIAIPYGETDCQRNAAAQGRTCAVIRCTISADICSVGDVSRVASQELLQLDQKRVSLPKMAADR
jgi:pyridoxal biosynthesis lyase PdxS